jgi:hypothetical protein
MVGATGIEPVTPTMSTHGRPFFMAFPEYSSPFELADMPRLSPFIRMAGIFRAIPFFSISW